MELKTGPDNIGGNSLRLNMYRKTNVKTNKNTNYARLLSV